MHCARLAGCRRPGHRPQARPQGARPRPAHTHPVGAMSSKYSAVSRQVSLPRSQSHWPRSAGCSAPGSRPGQCGPHRHLSHPPSSPLKQAPASFTKSSTMRGRWAKPGALTSSYTEGCREKGHGSESADRSKPGLGAVPSTWGWGVHHCSMTQPQGRPSRCGASRGDKHRGTWATRMS